MSQSAAFWSAFLDGAAAPTFVFEPPRARYFAYVNGLTVGSSFVQVGSTLSYVGFALRGPSTPLLDDGRTDETAWETASTEERAAT